MTNANGPTLNGCRVLPPMDPPAAPQRDSPPVTTRKQSANRFASLNAFVDVTMAELCRGDIVVWMILYRDTKQGTARTSQADIGRRAGLSVRAVKTAVQRLCRRGLLTIVFRGSLNRGPSIYRVHPTPENARPP